MEMKNTHGVEILTDKFISYLRVKIENPEIDLASPLVRLQGGYETATYRFELDNVPDELSRPLMLRLYPHFYGTKNAIWESTVQNVLLEEGFPVAQSHLVCTDLSVLGGAFFIMDHLPGRVLATAPRDSVPDLLGKSHAKLHDIDPTPFVEVFANKGIPESEYQFTSRFGWINDQAEKLPWLRQAANWLLEHRPPEPEHLSVCHGDFHPFNLLYEGDVVTGVLDWPGFAIGDPVFDIANTIVIITISAKHLAGSMGDFSSIDWDLMADLYLAAYRAHRPLNETNLGYYQARRCVLALVQGFEGQQVWQHPLIVQDLLACILDITGIRIRMPE
jgi:aminoglycoside phosphotransferase (APT) family kinase protein